MNDLLSERFYTSSDPLHFAPLNRLKKELKNIKKDEIFKFLLGQSAHTMFLPRKSRFLRRKIIKKEVFEIWSLDLADLQPLRRWNKGMGYILVCVDNFSNFVILIPVATKGKADMKQALESFINKIPERKMIKYIHSDRGE